MPKLNKEIKRRTSFSKGIKFSITYPYTLTDQKVLFSFFNNLEAIKHYKQIARECKSSSDSNFLKSCRKLTNGIYLDEFKPYYFKLTKYGKELLQNKGVINEKVPFLDMRLLEKIKN